MTDIETRADVEKLVDAFYEQVREHPSLGPVFDEVAGIDWGTHLPRMYAFWETVLFHTAGYKGNPVRKHVESSRKVALTEELFQAWLHLFSSTVDAHFKGSRATQAKERATVMGSIMLYKCSQPDAGSLSLI